MQILNITAAFLVLLLTATPGQAARTTSPTVKLWLNGSLTHFWYREFNPYGGDILDQEYGWLPGIGMQVDVDRNNLFLEGSFHVQWRKLPYDGHTQGGVPATTDTNETIWDTNGRIGGWTDPATRQTALYTGLGYRQWYREILSSSAAQGLTEIYSFSYALLGLKTRLYEGDAANMYFDFHFIYPLDAEMEVDSFRILDASSNIVRSRKTTLDLGEKHGFYIALPFVMHSGGREFKIEPFYEYTQFGISPAKVVRDGSGNAIMVDFGSGPTPLAILEPKSETEKYGVKFGMTF